MAYNFFEDIEICCIMQAKLLRYLSGIMGRQILNLVLIGLHLELI